MEGEEEFIEKAVEGWCSVSSTGEVCTCPSRALIHESIYEPFMARVMEKVAQIRRGDPLDTDTMIGAQLPASSLTRSSPIFRLPGKRADKSSPAASGRRSRRRWIMVFIFSPR